MRLPQTLLAFSALLFLGTPSVGAQATPDSEVVSIDSLRAWYSLGLFAQPAEDGDSVLTDVFISYLTPGDTLWPRRWALYGGSWLLAQAAHRHMRRASVLFLWPKNIPDSAPPGPRPSAWSILFVRDSVGCWAILNDTTPVSSCQARDDPSGVIAKPTRAPTKPSN